MNAIDRLIEVEGGYVNDPDDSGGETNFGITVAVARASGYEGEMRDMGRIIAYNIYARKYQRPIEYSEIFNHSPIVAHEVLDTAVNMGVRRASRFFQRALNVLNRRGELYSDIRQDGSIGPATIAALSAYLNVRAASTLVKALNCIQGAAYIDLCERRQKDEKYLYGWLRNRVIM